MGREAAETGFIFHPGFVLPAASAGGRGEESRSGLRRGELGAGESPWPRSEPAAAARTCRGTALSHPPRCLLKHRRGSAVGSGRAPSHAEDPRPGPAESPAGRRTRGPAGRFLRGPCCPLRRPEELCGWDGAFLSECARA